MNLSLCMIVKNEEERLPRCLSSVQAFVDEMVILDTGSTDQTIDIAQQFGAKVHGFPWCDDFALARNQSLRYAQGDWVLVLDADEVLVASVVPVLRQILLNEQTLVVNLVRQEVGASQSPYSLVSRLFRRHPALTFSRPYHAMVDDSVEALLLKEPHWQIMALNDIAILHEGYQPGAIARGDKLARAQAAMEKFRAQHPTDAYVCSKLGALYVQMGDLEQGVHLLELGLKNPSLETSVRYELHYHLGLANTQLRNPVQAVAHYRAALEQPILPRLKLGAYNNLANLLKSQGDLARAQAIYDTVLAIDPTLGVAHYNRGLVLRAQGRLQEAIAAYEQAIALNPTYAEAHQNMGVALLKLGQFQASQEAFQRAIALYEKHQPQEAKRLQEALGQMGIHV